MAGPQRVDPYLNFRFRVEMDGIQQAGFMECTGLGSQVDVLEYREGGIGAVVHKLPGKVSYPDITLKWGITDSKELYQWHLDVIRGHPETVHVRTFPSIVEAVGHLVDEAWPA